ncbi:MAG: hypothetical protein IJ106_16195, partial [Parasporobacterium sp.]|nr:hypothetical protein [Parasporobacterium sp.]
VLALLVSAVMVFALAMNAAAEPAEGEVTVTFSTGETATAVAGEPFVFFFQCDAPGDMGEPAKGQEGAGITVSSGEVAYENVSLGGPFSYPTSEKVIVTGFDGDFEVTVADAATQMEATHTIYFTQEDIDAAVAHAEEMAAQMANSEGGESPEGESPEGEAPSEEGQAPAEGESPEGESPEGEAPSEEGQAPAEGESEGGSGESAPSEFEGVEYPEFDIAFTPYSSENDYTVYNVRMTMQAGFQEFKSYAPGIKTIHAGIGYLDPFGEGFYYAGIMYPESFSAPEATYVSDWMDANIGCSLFCIYHTNAGDIYAWDGIYGANAKDLANYMSGEDALTADEVNGTMPTRSDALINIVAGGTGMFKGAYGVLIGSTSGGGIYGTTEDMTLPQTLFKYMKGYIVVPDDCENAALYEVTQELSEEHADLEIRSTEYAMVPLTLRMQQGSLEENDKAGSGIGTLLPYNAGAITVDYEDCSAAADYDVHNYVNDNWLAAYGEPEFMTIHIDDGIVAGDVYAYKFSYGTILDPSSDFANTGSEEAEFFLMIDGTDDFAGVTGILSGFDVTADPEGWGIAEYDNDLPLSHQTWAEGYMKVPAESPAALYGNDMIMD